MQRRRPSFTPFRIQVPREADTRQSPRVVPELSKDVRTAFTLPFYEYSASGRSTDSDGSSAKRRVEDESSQRPGKREYASDRRSSRQDSNSSSSRRDVDARSSSQRDKDSRLSYRDRERVRSETHGDRNSRLSRRSRSPQRQVDSRSPKRDRGLELSGRERGSWSPERDAWLPQNDRGSWSPQIDRDSLDNLQPVYESSSNRNRGMPSAGVHDVVESIQRQHRIQRELELKERARREQQRAEAARSEKMNQFRRMLKHLERSTLEATMMRFAHHRIEKREDWCSLIDIVYDEAVCKTTLCAELCKDLALMHATKINLSELLAGKCWTEFQNGWKEVVTQKWQQLQEQTTVMIVDYPDFPTFENNFRTRSMSSVRFIAELFKVGLVSVACMKEWLAKLLSDPRDEELLKGACSFLTIAGKQLHANMALDAEEAIFERYIARMTAVANSEDVSSARVLNSVCNTLHHVAECCVPRREMVDEETRKMFPSDCIILKTNNSHSAYHDSEAKREHGKHSSRGDLMHAQLPQADLSTRASTSSVPVPSVPVLPVNETVHTNPMSSQLEIAIPQLLALKNVAKMLKNHSKPADAIVGERAEPDVITVSSGEELAYNDDDVIPPAPPPPPLLVSRLKQDSTLYRPSSPTGSVTEEPSPPPMPKPKLIKTPVPFALTHVLEKLKVFASPKVAEALVVVYQCDLAGTEVPFPRTRVEKVAGKLQVAVVNAVLREFQSEIHAKEYDIQAEDRNIAVQALQRIIGGTFEEEPVPHINPVPDKMTRRSASDPEKTKAAVCVALFRALQQSKILNSHLDVEFFCVNYRCGLSRGFSSAQRSCINELVQNLPGRDINAFIREFQQEIGREEHGLDSAERDAAVRTLRNIVTRRDEEIQLDSDTSSSDNEPLRSVPSKPLSIALSRVLHNSKHFNSPTVFERICIAYRCELDKVPLPFPEDQIANIVHKFTKTVVDITCRTFQHEIGKGEYGLAKENQNLGVEALRRVFVRPVNVKAASESVSAKQKCFCQPGTKYSSDFISEYFKEDDCRRISDALQEGLFINPSLSNLHLRQQCASAVLNILGDKTSASVAQPVALNRDIYELVCIKTIRLFQLQRKLAGLNHLSADGCEVLRSAVWLALGNWSRCPACAAANDKARAAAAAADDVMEIDAPEVTAVNIVPEAVPAPNKSLEICTCNVGTPFMKQRAAAAFQREVRLKVCSLLYHALENEKGFSLANVRNICCATLEEHLGGPPSAVKPARFLDDERRKVVLHTVAAGMNGCPPFHTPVGLTILDDALWCTLGNWQRCKKCKADIVTQLGYLFQEEQSYGHNAARNQQSSVSEHFNSASSNVQGPVQTVIHSDAVNNLLKFFRNKSDVTQPPNREVLQQHPQNMVPMAFPVQHAVPGPGVPGPGVSGPGVLGPGCSDPGFPGPGVPGPRVPTGYGLNQDLPNQNATPHAIVKPETSQHVENIQNKRTSPENGITFDIRDRNIICKAVRRVLSVHPAYLTVRAQNRACEVIRAALGGPPPERNEPIIPLAYNECTGMFDAIRTMTAEEPKLQSDTVHTAICKIIWESLGRRDSAHSGGDNGPPFSSDYCAPSSLWRPTKINIPDKVCEDLARILKCMLGRYGVPVNHVHLCANVSRYMRGMPTETSFASEMRRLPPFVASKIYATVEKGLYHEKSKAKHIDPEHQRMFLHALWHVLGGDMRGSPPTLR